MTLEILKEILLELINRKLVSPRNTKIFGKCIRKAITESTWDYDYDVIHLSGLVDSNKLPKIRNKYSNIIVGYQIRVGNKFYIIDCNSYYGNYHNQNNICMTVFDLLNKETIELLDNSLDHNINEEDFLELTIDSVINRGRNLFPYIPKTGTIDRLSNVYFSCLNHRNYSNVYEQINHWIPKNEDLRKILKRFDEKYSFNYDRVACRILILCTWCRRLENFSPIEETFSNELKMMNVWKNTFIHMGHIINRIHREKYNKESPETQARFILNEFKEHKLSDDLLEDVFLPVYYCFYPSDGIDVSMWMIEQIRKDENYLKLPINGKDVMVMFPNIKPHLIGNILKSLQFEFYKNPELTKEELLQLCPKDII